MKASQWIAENSHLTPGPARANAVNAALAQSPYFGGWCKVPYAGGTLVVSCDYVSIGEPGDSYRVPLDAPQAQAFANAMGAMLPTAKMSDLIWEEAKRQGTSKAPQGMVHTAADQLTMMHEATAIKHQKMTGQHVLGELWAGHKKDVILSNRLLEKPASVAIYGFHQSSGSPIQPESTKHEAAYYDYSHGARLVQTHDLEGNNLREVLSQPGNPLMRDGHPLQVFAYGEASDVPGPLPGPANDNVHVAAREVILSAYKANGVQAPTLGELQFAQGVALGESGYGKGFDQTGFPDLHNWGAVLCPMLPPCGEGCAQGPFDSQVPGGGSKVCVKRYSSDLEGASDMVRIILKREGAQEAMLNGDLHAFTAIMGTPPVYSMFAHNNPSGYSAWLRSHMQAVAKGLSEPLAIGGSAGIPLAVPVTRPRSC